MTEMDGITVRVMTGRTPLGRRLAMVADVDMVVTISGKQHTEVVVEHALELGLPVLPIPNAGGDSRDLLRNYRKRIAAGFDPGALDKCLADVSKAIGHHPEAAASAVVDLIRTAKLGRCLVLLPYDDVHNELYTSTIEPSVARHMIPVRLDRLALQDALRVVDHGALIGRWPAPELDAGLLRGLEQYPEGGRGQPCSYCVLSRGALSRRMLLAPLPSGWSSTSHTKYCTLIALASYSLCQAADPC